MKRVFSVLLCAALCLGLLTSCGLLVGSVATPIVNGKQNEAEQTARNANSRVLRSAAMIEVMTNDIPQGAWGWSATGSFDEDGALGTVTVTPADSAVTDIQPTSGVSGSYTVGVDAADLG